MKIEKKRIQQEYNVRDWEMLIINSDFIIINSILLPLNYFTVIIVLVVSLQTVSILVL